MTPTNHRLAILGVLALAFVSIAGCGGSDEPAETTRAKPEASGGSSPARGAEAQRRKRRRANRSRPPGEKLGGGRARGTRSAAPEGFPPDSPPYVGRYRSELAAGEMEGRFDTPGPIALTIGAQVYDVSTEKAAFGGSLKATKGTLRFGPPRTGDTSELSKVQRRRLARSLEPCGMARGVYAWERSGETLTLNAREDGCAERRALLDGEWSQTR